MSVLQVTGENFEREVLKADRPVILDFYADWCGPCKMLGPILDEISKDHTVYKVNVDNEPELAQNYGIMSIPCMIIFKDGKEVNRMVGLRSKSDILELLK